MDVPVHGLQLDPAVLVLVAVVCLPLAEAARAAVAVLLGDSTPREAGRLWRVDRNLHLFGTVLVPALLALVGGVVVGWPAHVPVRDRALSRPRRAMVALAAPLAHVVLAGVGALLPGEIGRAVTLVNLLTAALLLVPAPPLHGGSLLAALVPAIDAKAGRWDRWRRSDTSPWLLAVLALVVAWHTVTR